MPSVLLDVQHLTTSFGVGDQNFAAVQDVGFSVSQATTVALVGESGCGKSVTALSILGLIQSPPGHIDSGKVLFGGQDLLALDDQALRKVRGNRIAMIFQEPMTSLNPVFSVGSQVAEGLILHQRMRRSAARMRTIELLQSVGIPAPEQRLSAFPHQLSGGMRQRVMIAMALACSPDLLIADEPTTALDVTIQAQILQLLSELQRQCRMSILLITHDLGIVAQHAQQVIVMYAGRVVETANVDALFSTPLHPYTAGLLTSVPAHALQLENGCVPKRLPTIDGIVPVPGQYSSGCRFSERCERRQQLEPISEPCSRQEPDIRPFGANRSVRCHFPLEDISGAQ
jgi:peptide/nickel transport system ATP-binding protein